MTFPVDAKISFCAYIDGSEECEPGLGRVAWFDNQHMEIQFLSISNHN